MATRTAYAGTALAGDVYTAANHARMPGGAIGYVETAVNQNGFSAEVDATSLTVTLTPNSSRRLKVSGQIYVNVGTATSTVILRLKEDGVTIQQSAVQPNDTADFISMPIAAMTSPTAASHTWKFTVQVEAGTADVENSTSKGWILVEDLGPTF